jgi:hypothetical protein
MYGMRTFDQDLMRLLQEGLITRETALAAATSPADLELRLRLGDDEEEEMLIVRHQIPEPVGAAPDGPPPAEPPGALKLDIPAAPPDRRKT